MNTTISLVSICHHIVTNIFIVIGVFRSTLLAIHYSMVTIVTRLYMTYS